MQQLPTLFERTHKVLSNSDALPLNSLCCLLDILNELCALYKPGASPPSASPSSMSGSDLRAMREYLKGHMDVSVALSSFTHVWFGRWTSMKLQLDVHQPPWIAGRRQSGRSIQHSAHSRRLARPSFDNTATLATRAVCRRTKAPALLASRRATRVTTLRTWHAPTCSVTVATDKFRVGHARRSSLLLLSLEALRRPSVQLLARPLLLCRARAPS